MEVTVIRCVDDKYQVRCESAGLPGSVFLLQFDDDLFSNFRVMEFVDMIKTYFTVKGEITVVYVENSDDDNVLILDELGG